MYPYGIRGERDVKECAISGAKIRPGDMAVNIAGTRLFYRVSSRHSQKLTDELKAGIEAAIVADYGSGTPAAESIEPATGVRGLRRGKEAVETPEAGES